MRNETSVGNGNFEEKLCELLQLQAALEVDIDYFSGEPLEYRYFMTTFEEVVEKKIRDPKGRLTRLIKYTKGEAKELIRHCIQRQADDGYSFAKQLLEKRYNNPHRVLAAYRKELKQWKQINPGDAVGFQRFYSFLIKCSSLVEGQYWNTLDSPENLCQLTSKLPGATRERWNRKAFNIRKREFRESVLRDFVAFVDEETLLANDPLFSKDAMGAYGWSAKSEKTEKKKTVFNNLATKMDRCALCNFAHDLDDCARFKSKDLVERSKFISTTRLCFGCYGNDHIARNCKDRRTCKTCNGRHPTGLHGYLPKPKEYRRKYEQENTQRPRIDTESQIQNGDKNKEIPKTKDDKTPKKTNLLVTQEDTSTISMSVVPVLLRHPEAAKDVMTYALLDNCSQGTFVHKDLVSCLGIKGVDTTITVKTLNGQESELSEAVTGMMVRGSITKEQPWVTLPKTYTRPNLPVDGDEVPTYEKIKAWKYLDRISKDLSQDTDVKVGLLIGGDCPLALEPLEIIKSEDKGPYAFRTKLGWCVVGPITASNTPHKIKCNRIILQHDSLGNPVDVAQVFIKDDQVEDVGIRDMVKQMYEADFNETTLYGNQKHTNEDVVSLEDKQFMNLMDNNVRLEDGHYVVPLPFRCKEVFFPNNRCIAVRRAEHLKRKFKRDPKFHEDYVKFIGDMISNGYARKSSRNYKDGNNWFIPHHGVYHPNKPGKIRVVFDCSSEFKDCSLNKELLQGPDLTNHLIKVLTRFRKEHVAFMADIEAMFYQVRIPDDQRGFVQFLWWEDGDYQKDLATYEMCVHIFGGTSSPSCCNYALKKTGRDNRNDFGEETYDTLMRNFYVDDLLKSTPDVAAAINLINNIKAMCLSGGFNLTKFISNKLEVLAILPDTDRRKSVQDLDLSVGSLPLERALGVVWNIENDTMGFRINLKDTPMTRRGLLATISSIYDPLGLAAPYMLTGRKILQQLIADGNGWDNVIPEGVKIRWQRWRDKLPLLEAIEVQRCFKPEQFGAVTDASLHHFSDASEIGYGQVSYLRLQNENDEVHCSLVIGKSRVSPLKNVSIPRLELTAATLSVKVGVKLHDTLEYENLKQIYWTDSKVVLGYIKNESKRFKIFVSNRVSQIRDY